MIRFDLIPAAADQPGPEARPDGKMYLEAVVRAGQQSRQILYFILILMVLTVASLRNDYSPDWMAVRVPIFQELVACLEVKQIGDPACTSLHVRMEQHGFRDRDGTYDLKRYAGTFGVTINGKMGDADFEPANRPTTNELKQRIDAYIKKDVDLDTITIPVLGVALDVNDLWMISGLMMSFLLYLLNASIQQEFRNMYHIATKWPGYLGISIMNQTLSYMTFETAVIYKVVRSAIWLAPSMIYICLFWLDYTTNDTVVLFCSATRAAVEIAIEAMTVLLVIYLNISCLWGQIRLERLLRLATDASRT